MGCSSSHSLPSPSSKGKNCAVTAADAEGSPYLLIYRTPDPDFGWRRTARCLPHGDCVTATLVTHKDIIDTWASSSEGVSSNLYPKGLTVYLFNQRSGSLCCVSIATLAINISVRAEKLAENFGVVKGVGIPSASQKEGLRTTFLDMKGSSDDPGDAGPPRREIYARLKVPDFGWLLLSREHKEPCRKRNFSCEETVREGSLERVPPQLLKRGPRGQQVLVDTSAVGMNIAEQLRRLESGKTKQTIMPDDSFGWRFESASRQGSLQVRGTCPEGREFWFTPEEIIMNVTEWVQQTYSTSVIL